MKKGCIAFTLVLFGNLLNESKAEDYLVVPSEFSPDYEFSVGYSTSQYFNGILISNKDAPHASINVSHRGFTLSAAYATNTDNEDPYQIHFAYSYKLPYFDTHIGANFCRFSVSDTYKCDDIYIAFTTNRFETFQANIEFYSDVDSSDYQIFGEAIFHLVNSKDLLATLVLNSSHIEESKSSLYSLGARLTVTKSISQDLDFVSSFLWAKSNESSPSSSNQLKGASLSLNLLWRF